MIWSKYVCYYQLVFYVRGFFRFIVFRIIRTQHVFSLNIHRNFSFRFLFALEGIWSIYIYREREKDKWYNEKSNFYVGLNRKRNYSMWVRTIEKWSYPRVDCFERIAEAISLFHNGWEGEKTPQNQRLLRAYLPHCIINFTIQLKTLIDKINKRIFRVSTREKKSELIRVGERERKKPNNRSREWRHIGKGVHISHIIDWDMKTLDRALNY